MKYGRLEWNIELIIAIELRTSQHSTRQCLRMDKREYYISMLVKNGGATIDARMGIRETYSPNCAKGMHSWEYGVLGGNCHRESIRWSHFRKGHRLRKRHGYCYYLIW